MPDAMVVFSAPGMEFRRTFGLGLVGTMRLAAQVAIAVRSPFA